MNVIIYTRVSTKEQGENSLSLPEQERRLRSYCENHNKTIVAHFQDKSSAKSFDRPQFQLLLASLRNRSIKAKELICVRHDRFSRNVEASIRTLSELKELGVQVRFVENDTDLSQPENLLLQMINLTLPQIDNDRKSLNVTRAMRQGLRDGRWMWKAPKGYANDTVNKTITISADAKFIKVAFERVASGIHSIDKIRLDLNKMGFNCSKQQFLNL